MRHARIAGNSLRQFESLHERGRLEKLFDALVDEVHARFEIDNRFAFDAEAKMAGLDDARVNGTDRDFVEAFAFDAAKRIGFAFVGKISANSRIFQQRMIIGWPKLVQGQTAQIGMPGRHEAKQIMNLALEAAREIPARRERRERWILGGDADRGDDETGGTVQRENIAQGESPVF